MFKHITRRRSEAGFTLIELLIVVIVIGVLAAIALPLYLNTQKQAVDASVQSDVRNTVGNVQTWLVTNSSTAATSTAAYVSGGGKVVQTGANVINVTADGKGSYTVCGYTSKGSRFAANTSGFAYDSTTGKFQTVPGCAGDSGTPVITTSTLPDGIVGTSYDYTITATGPGTLTYGATNLPAGLSLDTGTGRIFGTPTATSNGSVTITVSTPASVTRTLNLRVQQWVSCAAENANCAFTGTTSVRYGAAPSSYFYKTLTNGTPCTNAVFGDPVVGTVKNCAYLG